MGVIERDFLALCEIKKQETGILSVSLIWLILRADLSWSSPLHQNHGRNAADMPFLRFYPQNDTKS